MSLTDQSLMLWHLDISYSRNSFGIAKTSYKDTWSRYMIQLLVFHKNNNKQLKKN
uniref:Uncharacterized protein n=1 Tax=Rhizophora mucronata TaxID=61149 RepID=A0A2P2MVW2_RHIMU